MFGAFRECIIMPKKFKYVRIQGKELAENTMYAKGIFSMCWQLVQDNVMDEEDADLFKENGGISTHAVTADGL